jgi:hypothetical protein
MRIDQCAAPPKPPFGAVFLCENDLGRTALGREFVDFVEMPGNCAQSGMGLG